MIDITILCKVVDNFGDIGVVYRLARALKDLNKDNLRLRIVIDNLHSFSLLMPEINSNLDYQKCNDLEIFKWDKDELCFSFFEKEPPKIILECFQCGRPSWLEKLLFETKVSNIVNIIMIDYLTAEDYAETFHCLQSLTRSSRVKKVNFMPGFTNKTGGLILDKAFCSSLEKAKNLKENKNTFDMLFFNYERDCVSIVKAINSFICKTKKNVKVIAAKGIGLKSFVEACNKERPKFDIEMLDFIRQEEWDYLMCKTPFLFIRGEDSLSRACLCEKPFIWNAYVQSEDYQLVKVRALLNVLKPFFTEELYKIVENCWLIYNGVKGDLQNAVESFLFNYENLCEGFKNFSLSIKKNGDLAFHLMTFILKTCMIE